MTGRDVAIVGLLAAVSVVVVGYAYGQSDLAVYLPLIEHARHPSWLSRDWFVTRGPGVHGPYVWLMAEAGSVLPLPVAFFVIHLIERILLVAGIVALGRALTGSRAAAWLGAIAVIVSYPWNPGSNGLLYAVTIPHSLATVPAVFALLLSVRRRFAAAAALAGVSTLLHVLIGLEVGVLVVACAVWREGWLARASWRAAAVFVLCAMPGALPTVMSQLGGAGSVLSGPAYIAIAGRLRAPWHYLPSFWAPGTYASCLLYVVAGIRGLTGRDGASLPDEGRRQAIFYLTAIAALWILGAVGVEWLASSTILKLQFFRMTIFASLFVTLLIGHVSAQRIERARPGGVSWPWLLVVATVDPVLFGSALTAQGVVDARHSVGRERRMATALSVIAAALTLCLVLDVGGRWRSEPGATGIDIGLKRALLVATVAVVLEVWRLRGAVMARRFGSAVLLGGAASVTIVLSALLVVRAGVTPVGGVAALAGRIRLVRQKVGPWAELLEWVQRNTPPSAVFLTPPYMEDFRVGAERAIVVDFKAFAFRDRDALEWERRLMAVTSGVRFTLRGNRWAELRAGYAGLTTQTAAEVGLAYGADYVVREASQPLALPVTYRNQAWTIYRLR